jgi:predicted nucleotidyltransferase
MTDDDMLQRALALLFKAAPSESRVILFGSRARGEAAKGSDYDFLVVEPKVEDRFAEMVRLASLLGGAMIPADVVVIDQATFDLWRTEPNSLVSRALREGRLYEPAA